jgi:hypothetical protein
MRTPLTRFRCEDSLGKGPTAWVRFVIWLLTFSQALDVRRRFLWASRKGEHTESIGQVLLSPASELGLTFRVGFDKVLEALLCVDAATQLFSVTSNGLLGRSGG